MEAQLEPLQSEARSGVGKTLIIPEPARTVRFIIRSKGPATGGEITFECCPMDTKTGSVWRAMKTVPVPTDIGVVTGYCAGEVSGMPVWNRRVNGASAMSDIASVLFTRCPYAILHGTTAFSS